MTAGGVTDLKRQTFKISFSSSCLKGKFEMNLQKFVKALVTMMILGCK